MQHKRSHRIVFYLNDTEVERLDEAVGTSDLERADYLRQVLLGASDSTNEDTPAHVRMLEEALYGYSAEQGSPGATALAVSDDGAESHPCIAGSW